MLSVVQFTIFTSLPTLFGQSLGVWCGGSTDRKEKRGGILFPGKGIQRMEERENEATPGSERQVRLRSRVAGVKITDAEAEETAPEQISPSSRRRHRRSRE